MVQRVGLVGVLCYLTATVIFLLLFFTSVLDPSWTQCGLMLVAGGLFVRSRELRAWVKEAKD